MRILMQVVGLSLFPCNQSGTCNAVLDNDSLSHQRFHKRAKVSLVQIEPLVIIEWLVLVVR